MLGKKTASAGSKTKEQNRAETAWRHPHPTQSPETTATAQTQQLPLSTANSRRRKCWSPSHTATSQAVALRAQDHLQGSHRQFCVAQGHKFPQTTLSCPLADASPCSQSLHQAEPHGCCNKALGTPRHSKHEAQPGTGTGWTLGCSVSPAHRERAPNPKTCCGSSPAPLSKHSGVQGSTKQLCLNQQNREGEEFRQKQGTHGAEKCSERLQNTTECCVQGTQAASVPRTS